MKTTTPPAWMIEDLERLRAEQRPQRPQLQIQLPVPEEAEELPRPRAPEGRLAV